MMLLCISGLPLRANAAPPLRFLGQNQQTGQAPLSPSDNVKQYMKFLDQRMNEIRQITANPSITNPYAQLRDKMEEVTRLSDELQDELATYNQQHVDLRKQLKDLTNSSAHWLDLLNNTRSDSTYDYSRKMAIQAVTSMHDLAVKLQSSQDQYFSHK